MRWVVELTRLLALAVLGVLYRVRVHGVEHLPGEGPVILAPNHGSYADPFLVAMHVRRHFCFMAKAEAFRRLSWRLLTALGAFPVRRGAHDEETFITARAVLGRGGGLVVFPDGGIYRGGDIGQHPRPGIGRLALEHAVPVVPAAIRGSRAVNRLRFPRVEVIYGTPLRFAHEPGAPHTRHQEVAEAVYAEIRRLYLGGEPGGADAGSMSP